MVARTQGEAAAALASASYFDSNMRIASTVVVALAAVCVRNTAQYGLLDAPNKLQSAPTVACVSVPGNCERAQIAFFGL